MERQQDQLYIRCEIFLKLSKQGKVQLLFRLPYYPHKNLKHTQGCVAVPPVLFDARQEGLEPADGTLTVSVQEGDDLTFGGSRPPQPGSDQTRTLLHPQDPHGHLQAPHVVLQLLLQEICHRVGAIWEQIISKRKIICCFYVISGKMLTYSIYHN